MYLNWVKQNPETLKVEIEILVSSIRKMRVLTTNPFNKKKRISKDKKKRKRLQKTNIAHPGNRTPVSTVGGYYDTTTPDALADFLYPQKDTRLAEHSYYHSSQGFRSISLAYTIIYIHTVVLIKVSGELFRASSFTDFGIPY
jgi:hypothetical protein